MDHLDTLAQADDPLGLACEAMRAQRAAEAQILRAAAGWADQHGDDRRSGGARFLDGRCRDQGVRDRLIQVGGEGTPTVREFCFDDLAVVLEVHPLAARSITGDALDLRHRLPLLDAVAHGGSMPVWVARKIARLTRHLPAAVVALIDERIGKPSEDGSCEAATLPPSRLLSLVEAMVIDADNAPTDEEREKARRSRFVNIDRHRQAPGISGVYGKVDDAGGAQLEDTIARIAQALAEAGDDDPVQVRRSKALAILGTPALALRILLCGAMTGPTETTDSEQPEADETDETDETVLARLLAQIPVEKLLPSMVLYLHLTDHTLFGLGSDTTGVARWEDVGPITMRHLVDLLDHGRVTVKPVWMPTEARPSDAYEYTGRLREAVHLLVPADVYPYAVRTNRRIDIDHPDPYREDGPPGQTGLHNAAPMVRHHHRIKTHGSMAVRQTAPGTYVWRTPHRHYRMTNRRGTHHVARDLGDAVFGPSVGEAHLAGLILR